MATTTMALRRFERSSRAATRSRARRRLPIENTVIFALAATFYIVLANELVFHYGYMINDAYTRVDNAFDVLYSRDPHLAAIGFFWGPIPSFFDLPFLAFKGLWPALATQAFAGSIEAALFSAGTVVILNIGLRWAGVIRILRWLFCVVWVANAMTAIYAVQGMSEAPFIFFFVASILVFLRWSESRRPVLLPLAGLLVGADCLCRNEALLVALLMGVAVVVQSTRDGGGWRKVETDAVLFGLAAGFVIMLWLGSAAVIFHDPLYLLHANGFGAAPPTGGGGGTGSGIKVDVAGAYGLVTIQNTKDAATVIAAHSLALCPAVVAFLALLGARFMVRRNRIPAVMLLAFGLAIPALDVFLLQRGFALLIRYQISVIPFTFLLALYVLRSWRGRVLISSALSLVMIGLLGVSDAITAQTVMDSRLAREESPGINALMTGQPAIQFGDDTPLNYGPRIAAQLIALDKDHGLIQCDSSTCFALNMSASDPTVFVVRSDRTWEASASQPLVYGVEYFLVPEPTGTGTIDRLNNLYPSLWQSGGGFATLVGSGAGGGPMRNWRLYRIVGPTGRGG